MIQKFKKWLTYGTVKSKYNLVKIALLIELILLIAIIVCLCKISNLKQENKELREQVSKTIIIDDMSISDPIIMDDPDYEYIPQTQKDSVNEE